MLIGCERPPGVVTTAIEARQTLRADVLGCWALARADGASSDLAEDWAPVIVRLDSGLATPPSAGGRQAIRLDSGYRTLPTTVEPGITGSSSWVADVTSDQLAVTFNNGFFGSVWTLKIPLRYATEGTVFGVSRRFTDVVDAPLAPVPVRAWSVPCRAPTDARPPGV